MSEWTGVLYLLGAAAGYSVFMWAQPARRDFGRAYEVLRDYPQLWLVAAMFETVRVTARTFWDLAEGAVSPDAFVRVVPPGVLPMGRELAVPALDAALHALMRLPVMIVEVWPVSLFLVAALLVNAGQSLRGLWVSPDGKSKPWRRLFTLLVLASALLHLGDVALKKIPSNWLEQLPELPPYVAEVLHWGGEFFVVTCGIVIQIWVIYWVTKSHEEIYEEEFLESVTGKLGGLFIPICLVVAVRMFWGQGVFTAMPERWLLCGALAGGLLLIAPLTHYLAGETVFALAFLRHFLWPLQNWDRVFWWGTAAGLNLVLLHICGTGMAAWMGEETWVAWCWNVFFAFLRSGISVWLLGALVVMIREPAAAPRPGKE